MDRTAAQGLAQFPEKLRLGGIAFVRIGLLDREALPGLRFGGPMGAVNCSVPFS